MPKQTLLLTTTVLFVVALTALFSVFQSDGTLFNSADAAGGQPPSRAYPYPPPLAYPHLYMPVIICGTCPTPTPTRTPTPTPTPTNTPTPTATIAYPMPRR